VATEPLSNPLLRGPKLAQTVRKLRRDHERMVEELACIRVVVDALPHLPQADLEDFNAALARLSRNLERHAETEEREVYPALRRQLGGARLEAAMVADHRAIEATATELTALGPDRPACLAALLHRLDALVTLHIAKEEEIVFPAVPGPEPGRSNECRRVR